VKICIAGYISYMTLDKEIQNKKTKYIILAFSVLILGTILIVGLKLLTVQLAKEYLRKAENTTTNTDRLKYSETSAALNETEAAIVLAGESAYALKDYQLAIQYYTRLNNNVGKLGSAEAYYQLGRYDSAKELFHDYSITDLTDSEYELLIKTDLSRGDINSVRKELAGFKTDDPSRGFLNNTYCRIDYRENPECSAIYVLDKINLTETDKTYLLSTAYNYFNTQSFPQTALALLREGREKDLITRDGLNSLANTDETNGNLNLAYKELVESLAKDQYYPQTYQQLISVAEKLGDKTAVSEYQTILTGLYIT